ncbi:hypothetical protein [Thermomonospora umbrina]|uniref:Uncharacterized protein n=1 Tax=Thermomonospora umbrina TaxID=111806 RepID=A0A3D9SP72_9ACTN|nr:hypothetical protein [Thermomonospora umbrina]REE97766.1 hypothetical protein DFJ69_3241 [Thermomonospora umbrina]
MRGRSGREWVSLHPLIRPGHLRPHQSETDVAPPHQVDLVSDEGGNTFGALRRFARRRDRERALALLAAAGPVAPVLLDLIEDVDMPPSVVTAWAPGRPGHAAVALDRLVEPDDLLAQLEEGRRWRPAEALRLLAPLGEALDRLDGRGFVPMELSPDHLVENGGAIRLVGLSRHVYKPRERSLPAPSGMSLATTQLIGGHLPSAGATPGEWRRAQTLVLLRLAGWMCCGLPPGSWGDVHDDAGNEEYLRFAGFASVPRLEPGRLAASLAAASETEQWAEAERRVRDAPCVVFYDPAGCRGQDETIQAWLEGLIGQRVNAEVTEVEQGHVRVRLDNLGTDTWRIRIPRRSTPQAAPRTQQRRVDLTEHYAVGRSVTVVIDAVTPDENDPRRVRETTARIVEGSGAPARARQKRPPVTVNPEAVRLGLLEEHGPGVVAVAAFADRHTSPAAALLSGAGWTVVNPGDLDTVADTVRGLSPGARVVIAGRPGTRLSSALTRNPPRVLDEVLPTAASGPRIAGLSAASLPFVADHDFKAFDAEVLRGEGGASLRRRTFTAGWALARTGDAYRNRLQQAKRDQGRTLRRELVELNTLYGADTELLLRVVDAIGRPGLRREGRNQLWANLRRAAPVLLCVPAHGRLREDLMHALLGRTPETLYSEVTRRLLPVAARLAEVYEPSLRIGERALQELLVTREGIRRLGLFGRLATALPQYAVPELLNAIEPLDSSLVDALFDIPAPSLQHLVGKLGSPRLLDALSPFIDGPDLDLLGQYTPKAWTLLLEGLRQPEHLTALGLGWALIVERDPAGAVDARVLLEIARRSGREPRYAVRALLETPSDEWAAVLASPEVSAAWLSAFGRLDVAPVLDAFPGAGRLFAAFTPKALRAAATAGLDEAALESLVSFGRGTGLEPSEVLREFLDAEGEPNEAQVFAGPAPAAWASARLAAGESPADVVFRLLDDPGLLRDWLVNGDTLPRRVLADTLGGDLRALGVAPAEGRRLVALLEDQPGLLELAYPLPFPSQRLRLLRLALDRPDGSLVRREVADALPDVLEDPDAERLLDFIAGDGLTFGQARRALDLGLDASGREMLRELGPLPVDAAVLRVASAHGVAVARWTAVLAQTVPSAPEVVASWGPRWLPLLAHPGGGEIARLLAPFRLPPHESARSSPWLLAAGHDGLSALSRHGRTLLDLVAATDPPPADAVLIDRLLTLGGNAAAYLLISAHGLPPSTWPEAIRLLAQGWDPEDVLLHFWSSTGLQPLHLG